eukprot:scaffold30241_cov28-Tisochrysis_lutea.AAC.2
MTSPEHTVASAALVGRKPWQLHERCIDTIPVSVGFCTGRACESRFQGHCCRETSSISPGGGRGSKLGAAPSRTNRPPEAADVTRPGTSTAPFLSTSSEFASEATRLCRAPARSRCAAAAATANASRGVRPSSSKAP